MTLPPIKITFMIAIYCSNSPDVNLGKSHWNSVAGVETRQWLFENGLINRIDNPAATEKGRAWVDLICSTPLPVQEWRRSDEFLRKPPDGVPFL